MKLVGAISLAVLASLLGLTVLGVFSANAEETVLRIYLCRKAIPVGSGVYDDANCKNLGGTTQYYKELEGITPAKVTSKPAKEKEFELETKTALIKCSAESSESTEWNPEKASGEGKTTVTFEGCAVVKPAACSIAGKKIVTKEMRGVMEGNEKLGNGVKFAPVSGTTVAVISMGAECALGKEVTLSGTIFGIAKNEESSLEFTNESSSLTLGKEAAKLRGKSIVQGVVEGTPHNIVEGP